MSKNDLLLVMMIVIIIIIIIMIIIMGLLMIKMVIINVSSKEPIKYLTLAPSFTAQSRLLDVLLEIIIAIVMGILTTIHRRCWIVDVGCWLLEKSIRSRSGSEAALKPVQIDFFPESCNHALSLSLTFPLKEPNLHFFRTSLSRLHKLLLVSRDTWKFYKLKRDMEFLNH